EPPDPDPQSDAGAEPGVADRPVGLHGRQWQRRQGHRGAGAGDREVPALLAQRPLHRVPQRLDAIEGERPSRTDRDLGDHRCRGNLSMRVVRRDERGVTIVLFALLLVVFTVFVAFAVDLGGAFNQRRQTQSGADFASLGAAQDLPDTSVNLVNRVKDLVNDTLGTSFTLADWQTANCTDAGALPV